MIATAGGVRKWGEAGQIRYNADMDVTYSIEEVKSRLSEALSYALDGHNVTITDWGEPLAEIRRVKPLPETTEQRIEELTRRGVISPANFEDAEIGPSVRVPGALQRFLEDRHRWP